MSEVDAALRDAGDGIEVIVNGKNLRLTSLDRVLWPETDTTKRDLLRYLVAAAPALVPWITNRPLTLFRCPEGVEGKCWYQTTCPHPPAWLRTATVPGAPKRRYCVLDDLAGLLWAGNRSAIELHRLQSTCSAPEHPTDLVFDLDPGPAAGIRECAQVALLVRCAFGERAAMASSSGSLGIHVYVPLGETLTYGETKAWAHRVAQDLADAHPELVTLAPRRADRSGRVYVDWAQNDPNRSLVAPFSPRALPRPTVAHPLGWEDLEAVAAGGPPKVFALTP